MNDISFAPDDEVYHKRFNIEDVDNERKTNEDQQ